jgi:hypothetical protein
VKRPLFDAGDHNVTALGLIAFVAFSAAGIEIENRQRDLHIRSGTLKVENVTSRENRGASEARL